MQNSIRKYLKIKGSCRPFQLSEFRYPGLGGGGGRKGELSHGKWPSKILAHMNVPPIIL